jgi:C-terminal processing protease CtpA/Prc
LFHCLATAVRAELPPPVASENPGFALVAGSAVLARITPFRREAERLATGVFRRWNGSRYRYLRLFSFNVSSARLCADQVAAILANLPDDGLIIDLRAKPGGNIAAAEGVLQLLSTEPITP